MERNMVPAASQVEGQAQGMAGNSPGIESLLVLEVRPVASVTMIDEVEHTGEDAVVCV